MALWGGLGQAATVAQLVGVDVGGLISMIMQAAVTAQQNNKECERLALRVLMIAELLPHLQDTEMMRRPEIRRPLVGLDDTLREAHEPVMSCQEKGAMHRLVMAGRQAEKFRDVQSRINSYLLVFPIICYIDITRRLDPTYRVPLPNDTSVPSPSTGSRIHKLELAEEAAQEVVFHGEEGEKFTFAELATATNNFASDRLIGRGGVGNVYIGRLPDGREVAIKQFRDDLSRSDKLDAFQTRICYSTNYHAYDVYVEHTILSYVHHKHIIRFFGCCMERQYKQEIKRSIWFWKKKVVDVAPILVFEYMKNSSLDKHLHGSLSSSSPVTTSWSMRLEIRLGVSRAIEYLHTHPTRPVIHRDIKTSNILLDAAWVPRLSDFGCSITWDDEIKGSDYIMAGTLEYIDPECFLFMVPKPTIDVFSFGVVMLEVLTGRRVIDLGQDSMTYLVDFALPLIEAGEVRKLLDRRLATEPTAKQLQAAELVAHTAASCVQLKGKDRPAISEVVAKLQEALELVRGDE